MSKRAVIYTYSLLHDLVTKECESFYFELKNGIPQHASLVDIIPLAESGCVVMVYESDEWQCDATEIGIITPSGERIMAHPYSIVRRYKESEKNE